MGVMKGVRKPPAAKAAGGVKVNMPARATGGAKVNMPAKVGKARGGCRGGKC